MSDSIIHRWSKQKSESIKTSSEAEDTVPIEPEQASIEESEAAEQESEEEEKQELPSLDSLTEESDYSAFMGSDVDAALKKLALRKLFKSPFYNIVDGLNDYDEDFTNFEALGDIITSDMKFQQELKAEREKLQQEEAQLATKEHEEVKTVASDVQEPGEDEEDDDNNEEPQDQSTQLAAQQKSSDSATDS